MASCFYFCNWALKYENPCSFLLWSIPCKMKLEVNSQISKHELAPVLLVLIHQKSPKIVGTMPLHLAFTFS